MPLEVSYFYVQGQQENENTDVPRSRNPSSMMSERPCGPQGRRQKRQRWKREWQGHGTSNNSKAMHVATRNEKEKKTSCTIR